MHLLLKRSLESQIDGELNKYQENILRMNILKSKDLYGNNFIFIRRKNLGGAEKTSGVYLMWRLTINFLYYFGATPFKCEFSAENGQWYLKTSWFHKIRSLLQAWMPFFMNEFNYALTEIQAHFAIEKPKAKDCLNLFYTLFIKLHYVLMFKTLFCHEISLTRMLNHIFTTCLSLEEHSMKVSRRCTKFIPYGVVGILLLARIVLDLTWCIKEFIPNHETSEIFSERFYKVFVGKFRNRFHMTISTTQTYTTSDYFIGLYEVWLKNISRVMWASFDFIISGLIPLTFIITINKFEELFKRFHLEEDIPPLTVCHLFDDLRNMSKHINTNWGTICLIWAFYNFTRNTFDNIVLSSTRDAVGNVAAMPSAISLSLFLYFSGEAHIKILKFGDWLTDQENWVKFKTETEKDGLQRILAQLDRCCVGIGKTGLYRLNYSFSAHMFVLGITLFVILVDT